MLQHTSSEVTVIRCEYRTLKTNDLDHRNIRGGKRKMLSTELTEAIMSVYDDRVNIPITI